VTVCGGERVEPEFGDDLVKFRAVHIVEIEGGALGVDDALERPAAVFVRHRGPVGLQPARGASGGKRAADAAMPVEDRAAGVEREGFYGHRRRRVYGKR